MKVLFVCKTKKMEVLGLMYLSAVVKQSGNDCKIVTIEEALAVTKEWKPDMIGYSILTGDQHIFKELNETLKSQHKFLAIVGNAHPTFFPKDCEWADCMIRGEAEEFMAGLLGSTSRYPDLDSIPWADRTDFPDMKIRDFLASRGCSYGKCGYCYSSTWERMFPDLPKVRMRSAKDVVKEIASTDAKFAYFQDSTFGASLKWLREFSERYQSVKIPYHAHLRPAQVTEERVRLLSDSNCVSVKIALETASDRLRGVINRGHTNNEDVYKAAKHLKDKNITLILQNILGLPTSTIEDDLETLEVNLKTKPAYSWSSIFQPYPATELAIMCEKEGYYTGDYSEIKDNFFEGSVLNFTDEHKEQIACLQRMFDFCVEMQAMPDIKDLTWKSFPKFIHDTMRKKGDKRMFPNITL